MIAASNSIRVNEMTPLPRASFAPALQRLDLMLHREILRLRAVYQLSLDEFRGLYMSDQQVDALIRDWHRAGECDADADRLDRLITEQTGPAFAALEADARWRRVVTGFALNPVQQHLLVLALAPELALKYETLFAYLNNDITRKYPTVDLALRVTDTAARTDCRRALSPAGVLVGEHLLEAVSGDASWSLATGFRAAPSLLSCLLDGVPVDARLLPGSEYLPAADVPEPGCDPDPGSLVTGATVTVLEGEPGAGRRVALRAALAAGGMDLLCAALDGLALSSESLTTQLQRLLLQARLGGAGLYLTGLDRLHAGDAGDRRRADTAMALLRSARAPVYIGVAAGAAWREWLGGVNAVARVFADPDPPHRERLWTAALTDHGLAAVVDDVRAVADRFVLNPGQISAAAEMLALETAQPGGPDCDAVFAAARAQSVGDIGKLAQKVRTTYRWDDLVLPRATLERINEAVAAVTNRGLVYQRWGMHRRVGGCSGLMMLFSGVSGTGKTMCANLIAHEVSLDLYRIDLSGVVSKYIGDTEKNLERIFTAARRANCILFFDEADALLGKRSEVKDAHDRYANVEIAYLLQKMEDHDGVVILATNIAKNIDPAFTRRLHYSIEFPRPNATHRERLWRGMFPPEAPLDADVDFAFLARQFEGTGGDIKTIALDAAMQAAGSGRRIDMTCLMRAMARQMIKQGKTPRATDFKQYYALIERGAERAQAGANGAAAQHVVKHPSANNQ